MELRIKLNLDSILDLVNEALKIIASYKRITGFTNVKNEDGSYTARLMSPYGAPAVVNYSNIFEFIYTCNENWYGIDAGDAVVRAILDHADRDDILGEEDAFHTDIKVEKTFYL